MSDIEPQGGAPAAPPPPPQQAAPAPAASWLDGITDPEARALVEQKKYGSSNDVAVAYRNMIKLHGKAPDVLALPEKDDDVEGWNNVHTRLGRPSEPTGYEYKPAEGIAPNEEYASAIREAAHKAGISQKQFAALASANDGFVKSFMEKQAAEASAQDQTELVEIQKAFGGEREYSAAMAAGQRAVKALGVDNAVLDKLDGAMGNLAVQKLFATIGQKIAKEADFIEGVDQQGFGMSPQMARSELTRLGADKDFQRALLSPMDISHKANLAKWQDLQRKAFGGGKQ
jgi:hypothetical protein